MRARTTEFVEKVGQHTFWPLDFYPDPGGGVKHITVQLEFAREAVNERSKPDSLNDSLNVDSLPKDGGL